MLWHPVSFKADHGFRKYFKTMAEQQMKSLHVEILMDHSTGLADNYYRISDEELLSEYLKAVPALSIFKSPLSLSNDAIEKLKEDMAKFKLDVLGMIMQLHRSGKVTPDELKNMALEAENYSQWVIQKYNNR